MKDMSDAILSLLSRIGTALAVLGSYSGTAWAACEGGDGNHMCSGVTTTMQTLGGSASLLAVTLTGSHPERQVTHA